MLIYKPKHKISVFYYIFLYFYRCLLINFGGLSIDSNGAIIKSTFWQVYGYLGLFFHLVLSFSFAILDHIYYTINNNNFLVLFEMILWIYLSILHISCCFFDLQINGTNIVKIISKSFSLNNKKLKIFQFIWLCYLFSCFLISSYQPITTGFANFLIIMENLFYNLIYAPLVIIAPLISWIISLDNVEKLKLILQQLNNDFISQPKLSDIKEFFIKNQKELIKIDKHLSLSFIFLAINSISHTMNDIYYIVAVEKTDDVQSLLVTSIFHSVVFILLIIANCLINGLVYEYVKKIIVCLDNINTINNDKLYKVLFFKVVCQRNNYGFTIGGFAPWNKITLVPVCIR